MCRLSGLTSACSGEASKKYDGCVDDVLVDRRRAERPAPPPSAPCAGRRGRRAASVRGDRARVAGHAPPTSSAPMSMPSSSALVDDHAADRARRAAPARSRAGAAAGSRRGSRGSARRMPGTGREVVLQVAGQHLGGRAAAARRRSSAGCRPQELAAPRAAPRPGTSARMPSVAVHDRRVDEHEERLAARRAVLGDVRRRAARPGVRPAARGLAIVADEQMNCGSDAVVPADALQAAQHVGTGGCRTRRDRCAARRSRRSAGSRRACAQRGWCGRMPACSMSGLVSTMWPARGSSCARRPGVSPS